MMCRSGSDVCKHRLLENIPEECFNFIVKGGKKVKRSCGHFFPKGHVHGVNLLHRHESLAEIINNKALTDL